MMKLGGCQKSVCKTLAYLFFPLLLISCASIYFHPLPHPEKPFRLEQLGHLPYRELWSGFVFNGEKVGFTYLKIEPIKEESLFRVTSEAHMHIKFLGVNKEIHMKSVDLVRPDLILVSFHYEQKLDEEALIIDGRVADGEFLATLCRGTHKKILKRTLGAPLYPSSLINLYPVLNGLEIGDEHNFQVFDPQVQTFLPVLQTVVSFEESSRLYIEPCFKVHTRVREHEVDSWVNLRGETVFELAMGGVLITYKEAEEAAKRYLSEASLNKQDLILDFSLVPTGNPIPCPRNATYLEIILEGIAGRLPLLQGPGQEARETRIEGRTAALYRLRSDPDTIPLQPSDKAHSDRFVFPSFRIESEHPEIKKKAAQAAGDAATTLERTRQLVDWVSEAVEDEPVESFSALEVLRRRKGECQAHTLLYTALARASGIPTRLVAGLVYMEGLGFLYHGWAESYVSGWISVDPTFKQVGVDATHIKLVEGDSWLALLQLGKVVGRVRAKVVDFKSFCQD